MKNIFVKLFSVGNAYYLYDVNINNLIRISRESFGIIQEMLDGSDKTLNVDLNDELIHYYGMGFLREYKEKEIKNIDSEIIMKIMNSNLKSLLLQITRDCNMRCKYCFYSGKYFDIRTHEKEYMSQEVAFKAIDFFFERAKKSEKINIGFYGGEPLLNFKLIKEVIRYIEKSYSYFDIQYSITTNGICLTPLICDFLVEKKALVTVSLDGPQVIHDQNRVLMDGTGSFKLIYRNLSYLFNRHHDFFVSNVRYNAVDTGSRSMVESFFYSDEIIKYIKGKISPLNNYHKNSLQSEFFQKETIDKASSNKGRDIRSIINYIKSDKIDQFNDTMAKLNRQISNGFSNSTVIKSGNCIPGVSRLFCNVKGDFYMCEKFNDISKDYKIGDVINGWSEDNIIKLANISNPSKNKGCLSCWAIHLCNMCAAKIVALDTERLNSKCDQIRRKIEYDMSNICAMRELERK